MPRPSKEELQERIANARAVRMANLNERKSEADRLAAERAAEPEPLANPLDELAMADHHWLGEPKKSLYIPSWYKPHRANYEVTQNGKRLGFRVGDVLPHRRWAIKGNGELMSQSEFEPLIERYMGDMLIGKVDPHVQHIPRVERYVNAMPDPRGGPGLVAIGFDPNVPPAGDDGMRIDPSKPLKDAIFSIKDAIDRGQALERKAQLADLLAKGAITGQDFEREMRAMAPQVEIEQEASPVA